MTGHEAETHTSSSKPTIGVLVGGEVIGGLGTYGVSDTQDEAGYNSTGLNVSLHFELDAGMKATSRKAA
jgi:hypothetical protein